MGILSTLFGRNKIKMPQRDRFFTVITAEQALRERTDVRGTHKAGIVFNPVESTFFTNLDTELRSLLKISGAETGTQFQIKDDTFGTRWVSLEDEHFEDLVSTIHLVSETIDEHGFGDRMLAAVFGIEYENKKAYWIFSFKRGSFYPMVLTGPQTRDNAAEMRLSALMETEKIPVDRSMESWYSLWGIPF
ncbi:MAG: hypothetical protein BZY79_01275 [SAR202 cluster bacterium Casp-Chloro-G4]|nr:hypothetical protein [Chloroflexota bacterium]PKB61930.1 MAG: hypothetical protein BZY79_01275 [SAR202 cluster bacterium Casp-Chloro-G4]